MEMSDIKKKAQALGITGDNMGKAELIRAIQRAEGYSPCYGKSDSRCMYIDCCFRQDCLKPKPVRATNVCEYLNDCRDMMQRINTR